MHEYSVVSDLLEKCETLALSHNAKGVSSIVVGVGKYSGIERALLESAFEAFKEESIYCKNANLELINEPVVLECRSCGESSSPKDMDYMRCSVCSSSDVSIVKGIDLMLLSVGLDIEEEAI